MFSRARTPSPPSSPSSSSSGSSGSSGSATPHRRQHILVLGGTSFLGRAVVVEALAAGHRITLFNRGITNPGLFHGVEARVGDRASDVSALAHGRWDAVVDVAAYHSDEVRRSVDVLADRVDHYVFVSTLSVYADHRTTESQTEDARLSAARQGR